MFAKGILYFRAILFTLGFYASTALISLISVLLFPFSFKIRNAVVTSWADFNVWWIRVTCGLDYEVTGLENVPNTPCVIMANHQSTWETLVLKKFFPPMVWVIKRELLWIPFFGWGMAMVKPISINRSSPKEALRQIITQARERVAEGLWVIIFPEGTRVAPGQDKRYGLGGAIVASKTGIPVIPVAHNAGLFWKRREFIKRPGKITVVIGPPIDSKGKKAEALTAEVKQWIKARQAEMGA